ncbi:MAG TPA: NAD-dependent epimerase/dehydratase family protein [Pseudomonadales bacterium]|nr:NAD-dependent epimerase/dehydratase family protein [Pseudomonadales bacterium]
MRIVIAGGAGLVGQNLIVRLKQRGHADLVVLDKHRSNLEILRMQHPDLLCIETDLAEPGTWSDHLRGAEVVVMLQAQIGGIDQKQFQRNNVDSTRHLLDASALHGVRYLVHVSSSVVESVANDWYTDSKKAQEQMVAECTLPHVILRPTLMFGWFDRKHLGWLSRFMRKVPLFPIPGHGRYMRQPLYAGDFCNILISCIEKRITGSFNISGRDKIDYIDIIRQIKGAIRSRTLILPIPYWLFHALLAIWALFDPDPPFTTQQLSALVADDEFEVIDWPEIFSVTPTPFSKAIDETFNDARYGHVVLKF